MAPSEDITLDSFFYYCSRADIHDSALRLYPGIVRNTDGAIDVSGLWKIDRNRIGKIVSHNFKRNL